jgi:hypothetical protein
MHYAEMSRTAGEVHPRPPKPGPPPRLIDSRRRNDAPAGERRGLDVGRNLEGDKLGTAEGASEAEEAARGRAGPGASRERLGHYAVAARQFAYGGGLVVIHLAAVSRSVAARQRNPLALEVRFSSSESVLLGPEDCLGGWISKRPASGSLPDRRRRVCGSNAGERCPGRGRRLSPRVSLGIGVP